MQAFTANPGMRRIVDNLLSAVLLMILAGAGHSVTADTDFLDAIRPASGLALTLLLRKGWTISPAIWLSTFVSSAFSLFSVAQPPAAADVLLIAAVLGISDMVQAGVGVLLLQKFSITRPFSDINQLFSAAGLLAVAALPGSICGTAVIGVIESMTLFVWWEEMLSFYLANVLGVFLAAPVLLNLRNLPDLAATPVRLADALAVTLLFAATAWLVIAQIAAPPYLLLLFPLIIWSAVRGGALAVSLSVLAAFIVAMIAFPTPQLLLFRDNPQRTIVTVQTGICILALTGLTVSAALAELRRTERGLRETMQTLQTTESRLQALIQHAPDAIVVHDVTAGRFVEVNAVAEQLFGLPRDELLKCHPADLSPETQPDGISSRQAAETLLRQVLDGAPATIEWQIRNARGQLLPTEVRLNQLPADGQCLVRVSITDITERKQLQERLDSSKENAETIALRLRLALEAGNVGLWDWDVQNNLVFYSEQFRRQLGYPLDTPMSTYEDWEQRVHPDDLESAKHSIAAYFNGETEQYAPEFRMRHQDGSYRWILSQGEILRDQHGQPYRMLGVHIDITERREARTVMQEYSRELEQRNAELSSFAYVASHDLKAPLRGIRQLAEWTCEDHPDVLPEDVLTNLGQIIERINRLDGLLNDLLMYSRAGRMHGNAAIINVADLLQEIIETVAVPPTFSVSVAADVPEIETYSTPLTQVLTNLISNAFRHHDRDAGCIEINVRHDNSLLYFAVSDDGPGIPPQQHERAFQVFETLSSVPKSGSTGVGLAIVRKAVEAYGGTVEILSSGERGTTIAFTWPRKITAAETSA